LLIFGANYVVMPLPLAPILISAIPSLVQAGVGLSQQRQSKKILDNLVRPTYNIPTAATEALGTARTLASSNQLPNQVQAEQAINQGTANALYNINQNATSGTEALAALTGVTANEMGAMNNLSGQAANFANSQNANLIAALGNYAQFQDRAFEYNQNQPFLFKANQAAALGGAGMQNMFNGFNNLAGVGANAMMLGGAKSTMGNTDLQNQVAGMDANKFQNNPFGQVKSSTPNMLASTFSNNMTNTTLPAMTPEQQQLYNMGISPNTLASIFMQTRN
jgi:hypothetical protein